MNTDYTTTAVYFPDRDPVYPGTEKEFNRAIRSVDDPQGGLGGSAHYIPRLLPCRIYRHAEGGEVDSKIIHSFEDRDAHLANGWSAKPLAPPPPKAEKDVTRDEYEANMRAAKAELQMEALQEKLEQMAQMIREQQPTVPVVELPKEAVKKNGKHPEPINAG